MASSSGNNDPNGRTIEEFTFKKYKFEGIQHIGHKSVEVEGKHFVNFVWCKLCAKHKCHSFESFHQRKCQQISINVHERNQHR